MKKEKLLDLQLNKEHYNAEAAIVWCFDARHKPSYDALVAQRGYRNPDPIFVAGGAKDIIHGEDAIKEYLLWLLAASMKLHNTHHIILMMHTDCGAYKDIYAKSGQDWHDFLNGDLSKAHEIVESYCNSHPNAEVCKKYWAANGKAVDRITVELVIADFDGIYRVFPSEFLLEKEKLTV
ncbi:MAG: hypothetical protein RL641_570 [Candidatus Parcubacteria bacterium]|jgi:carbonic anhydrase